MLYICCRETDGYQQVSVKRAATTAVHARFGCRRNQACHSQGPTCARTSAEAGGVGEAVRTESSTRSRGAAATRGRGTRDLLSAPRNGCRGVIARGNRRSVLHPDHAGNDGAPASRSQDDRGGLSKSRGGIGTNRQRSESGTFRGVELGISRNPLCTRGAAPHAEHQQNPSPSRFEVSPGWFRSRRLQERIARRPSRDSGSVSEARGRSSRHGFTSALIRVRQEYSFLCARSDSGPRCEVLQVGGKAKSPFHSPWQPGKSNPGISASYPEIRVRPLLPLQRCFGLAAPRSDSVVTFLVDESLTPNKSQSPVLFGSLESCPECACFSIALQDLRRLAIEFESISPSTSALLRC